MTKLVKINIILCKKGKIVWGILKHNITMDNITLHFHKYNYGKKYICVQLFTKSTYWLCYFVEIYVHQYLLLLLTNKKHMLHTHLHIYIYMCVCACARKHVHTHIPDQRTKTRDTDVLCIYDCLTKIL
jgi:hypothetical protein